MKLLGKSSLKVKLFVVLLTLTSSMLGAYSWIVLRHFENDKMAYVFDATTSHSRTTASQIRAELNHWTAKLNAFMKAYNYHTRKFHPDSVKTFVEDEFLRNISVFAYEQEQGRYRPAGSIKPEGIAQMEPGELSQILEEAITKKLSLRPHAHLDDGFWLALRYELPDSDGPALMVLAEGKKASFLDAFLRRGQQDTYLLQGSGRVLISPAQPSFALPEDYLQNLLQSKLKDLDTDVSVGESAGLDGESWLVSIATVGAGDLKVASLLLKSVAVSGVKAVIKESILFLIFLLSLAVIVSVLSSSKLTAALKELLEATKKVGQGDFDASIAVTSEDEVGGLAKGFNHMTYEIKRLMQQTAEKARMESELNTAKVVQATLFPKSDFDEGAVSLRGYYRPASECGGDWWFYNKLGDKYYLWIGDATGHGAPAALLTSAARSASEIIRQMPELSIAEVMSLMNKAVFGVGKGNMMMTFFLASFDPETGIFEYSGASHDPPFVFRKAHGTINRNNVEALFESQGPRLGERENSCYSSEKISLAHGDQVVFYTDGVTEMVNGEGKVWGERRFLKTLIDSYMSAIGLDETRSELHRKLEEHRGDAPLEDDVTYFLFQYQKSA